MLIGPPIAETAIWYFSTIFFLLMPPPIAIVYLVVLIGYFSWRLLLRPAARNAPFGDIGLRHPGPGVLWLVAAILTSVVLYVAFFSAYRHLVSHEPPPWQVLERYKARPFGQLALGITTVIGAPLMEEFVFRGVLQHALTRRFGPAIGIGIAALLFAMMHLLPVQIPGFFVFGSMAGLLVYRTGSLWAGIAAHAVINSSILIVAAAPGLAAFANDPTVVPFGWCVAALVVSTVVFVALLTRIRRAPTAPPLTLDPTALAAADGPPVALP